MLLVRMWPQMDNRARPPYDYLDRHAPVVVCSRPPSSYKMLIDEPSLPICEILPGYQSLPPVHRHSTRLPTRQSYFRTCLVVSVSLVPSSNATLIVLPERLSTTPGNQYFPPR